jgi:hypothetical protein
MRSIVRSTKEFEAWMKKRTDLSKRLLEEKHRKMATGAFPFLRATFYRWVERWREECPKLAKRDDDVLLAVGDLHVENFGVWLDARGWQVWGVNDFDDACELPFTSDLVRLATSAALAARQQNIDTTEKRLCRFLLDGYRQGLRSKGKPILVSEHKVLRVLTKNTGEDKAAFWKKKLRPKDNRRVGRGRLPRGLEDIFLASFPPGARPAFSEQKKPGGLGSLGRRRYTGVVKGGKQERYVAREAKALVPSALYWWAGREHMPSQTATLLQHAIRIPDPYFQVHDEWLVRQLAPDVAKIELPEGQHDPRLVLAPDVIRLMGRETANIHLGSRRPKKLLKLLARLDKQLGAKWFAAATKRMVACTRDDADRWQEHWESSKRQDRRD